MRKPYWLFILIVLFLTGCSAVSLPAINLPFLPQQVKCPSLKVGLLMADEKANPIAAEQNDGYLAAVKEINDGGGINGCPLTVVTATESGDEDSIQTRDAVRRLVEDEKVIAILGGTSNVASMQAVSLMNFFETPIIVPSAGGQHVIPAENLWGFRLQASESAYAQTAFQMVTDRLGKKQRIALVFEDTTEGHDAANAAVSEIESQGSVVSGYYAIKDINSPAYQNLGAELLKSRPQVVYLVFDQVQLSADVLLKVKDSQANFIIARSGGLASSAFLWKNGSLNPDIQNLVLATQWPGTLATQPGEPFFAAFDRYTQETYKKSFAPSYYNISAYKAMKILASVTGSVLSSSAAPQEDIKKLRASLREGLYAFQENTLFWGTINFSSGGQNPGNIVMLQVFDQKLVTVYPANRAEQLPRPFLTSTIH
jgi:ABC-type branched-subunit amino acid transport system substrate-binding protein